MIWTGRPPLFLGTLLIGVVAVYRVASIYGVVSICANDDLTWFRLASGDLPSVIVFRLRDMTPDSVNHTICERSRAHLNPCRSG